MRERVAEIDLLRFLAALAVVFFHYAFRGNAADGLSAMPYPLLAPVAKYGYLGVELFFMISGFVILMTASGGSLRKFAVSRIVRLYPAFWVCCTISFVAALAFGAPVFNVTLQQYLVNMTMLAGFVGVEDIDGVYWSLYVEMRFYLLVALLLLLRQIGHAQRWLAAWLVATAVLKTAPGLWHLKAWLLVDYAPYFIGGAVCYLVWKQGWSRARAALLAGSWALGLLHTMQDVQALQRHYHTDIDARVSAAIVSLCFAAMVLVATRRTGVIGRLDWRAVGALTYPLYLIHQNIGYMVFNAGYPALNSHLLLWGTIAAMMLLAHGVHTAVERPLAPVLKRFVEGVLGAAGRRYFQPAGRDLD